LRRARPDLEVVMITYPGIGNVLERQRHYVDEFLEFPGWPGIPDRPVDHDRLPSFLEEVKEREFDLAIQVYGSRAAANEATEALGARRTAGFFMPGAWQADLATHLPYPIGEHEIDRHLQLLTFLGVPTTDRRLEFAVTDADREQASSIRIRHRLVPGTYAVVHPGASAASRRWPPERFAQVAEGISRRGLRVVVTGTAEEVDATSALSRRASCEVVDLSGATNLGGFAALLADAALLVGNDSGPAHLAVALEVPSVTVFLSGDPGRWAYDDPLHPMVREPVACSPCGLLECPIDFRCASDLAADRVLATVDALRSRAAR
ncbi:MAG: glycosyltransferase family 9 protein, partial [Actinomycetota bacterium]|nr:glycosyltransferase family 9 protein [Actinomycetota bacterium]